MSERTHIAGLQVSTCLYEFVEHEVLVDLPIKTADFWQQFAAIIEDLSPINAALLQTRADLQQAITTWHEQPHNDVNNTESYKSFLENIGYIVPKVENFHITTENVDDELARMAGPQLVVPITNARFALNAVNARWGSLYDALYGTDAIADQEGYRRTHEYNPVRGQQVISYGRDFLDNALPLTSGSHQQAVSYQYIDNELIITLADQKTVRLNNPSQLLGFQGELTEPSCLLFEHNGLRFEINFNANSEIASRDLAGVSDITLESALTTIMDCEDSVATVDAEDKVSAYRNWLGLNQGKLSTNVTKNNQQFVRTMVSDKCYKTPEGNSFTLSGRSLMFIRNVGHLMTNDAIITQQGKPVYEGILDAMITATIALYDILGKNPLTNSAKKSIYIVKPKMHGPEEVAFSVTLFDRVERALGLAKNTIKMGIMDEERRTSVNLKACIFAAKERVVFINTGFLDRTGDEIHTSMACGAMERKNAIKDTPWISAYENSNVDIGLQSGLSKKAQIGKGMWPIPDNMADMLNSKIAHVNAGANTAWVPSPTAATLHALHYHQVDVFQLREQLSRRVPANLDDMLSVPLAKDTHWSEQEIADELDNNIQGILGYVVRWIDQGIGCSKVPDINDVGLMEDRATLRISSQHVANWLKHGICQVEEVENSFKKMAKIVDQQNSNDPAYQPMCHDLSSNVAFNAAKALVFEAETQPNGYTEPLLHAYRLKVKRLNSTDKAVSLIA
ncbi:malate synthase G [Thalassotalea sp. 1_MG-2023]|uniref:malate synthase G n=1 Tax=Thalassotalea sp. 1_MG-2023 TaxID=3062680 RepID=UPI0026E12236|nr:malate synthase G [Thalassotalea sp. 1_MG-2023]MDO6427476.1 malate synthase G [Thalassotalea sp. 1_MG-2023]